MRKDKLLSLLADTNTFGKSWSQISFGGQTLSIGAIGLILILQMPFVTITIITLTFLNKEFMLIINTVML